MTTCRPEAIRSRTPSRCFIAAWSVYERPRPDGAGCEPRSLLLAGSARPNRRPNEADLAVATRSSQSIENGSQQFAAYLGYRCLDRRSPLRRHEPVEVNCLAGFDRLS